MCYILYTLQPAAATVAANSYPDIYTAANPNATLDQLTEGTLHEQAAAQASAAAEVGYSVTSVASYLYCRVLSRILEEKSIDILNSVLSLRLSGFFIAYIFGSEKNLLWI